MLKNVIMKGKDALSAKLAECFITIDGRRFNFMQMINMEAKFDKVKTAIPVLGKTGKAHKGNGWEGTFSGTAHYNQSIMREMLIRYKDTGEDTYFEMQITNEDPTSAAGRQTLVFLTVILTEVFWRSLTRTANTLTKTFPAPLRTLKCPKNSIPFPACNERVYKLCLT